MGHVNHSSNETIICETGMMSHLYQNALSGSSGIHTVCKKMTPL